MAGSRIIAIGTNNPEIRMTQAEVLDEVLKHHQVSGPAQEKYRQFFLDHGIGTRHFGFTSVKEVFTETPDAGLARFTREAVAMGSKAAQQALDLVSLGKDQIDAIIVTTCTGYLCPGLATYIAEQLGLRSDVYFVDMVGQGCAAAIPALRLADYYVRSNPGSRVLCVCVEVCTAAFCDGEEPDLLLSNAIFGDGAAACIVSDDTQCPGFEIGRTRALLDPKHRDDLRFVNRNARLCNVLGRNVPVLASRAVEALLADLVPAGEKVDHYAFHPGGRAILDRIQKLLQLADKAMQPSRDVLYRYGNMSSPSVLFILKDLWLHKAFSAGETLAFFTYGAGFTAHGAWSVWRA